MKLSDLPTPYDIQQSLADKLKACRNQKKWTRVQLSQRSGVPESAIKKVETTGQISLRQFTLLWVCVADPHQLETLAQV